MTTFSSLGLAEPILKALSAEGYTDPTPIQAQVIPHMLNGRDILGIAQTGTGKTASFVLPLLNHIHATKERAKPKGCLALILAPTRELAAQIADSVRAYGRNMRHSATVIVGGVSAAPQIRAVKSGVDIIIATPGRLLDHLSSGDIVLDGTTRLVLDEADQMLDMGFIPALRKIMTKLPRERQTVLLSATMPPQIRALAHDFMKNPCELSVAPASKPIERIAQKVIHLNRADKRNALVQALNASDVERAIVFTRTKRGADKVSRNLQQAGLSSSAIHGNKSQNQRNRALDDFKTGKIAILVATDIAARGIDIDNVSHVVNFELPNVPEAYVHRIGRTARAGKAGVAVSFCDPEERGLLRDIEKLVGRLPAESFDGSELPAQQTAEPTQKKAKPTRQNSARQQPGKPKPSRRSRRSRNRRQGDASGGTPDGRGRTRQDAAPDAGLARMLGNIDKSQKSHQKPAQASHR